MTININPWPHYAGDEVAAVAAVLESGHVNYWTGNEARQFEREYAELLGLRYAIGLMNGTVALELPLRMWGIGPGDEVIVTPRSFIASVSAAVLQGARPVFADVDRDSQNVTVETIERVLTPRTRAIIPVHLAGWPCDMDGIMAFAEVHGIRVLEDCAQSHGATIRGRPAGSFGHAAAFSFCQDKIITTGGEGGLLATDDESLWRRAWAFKDHGKSYAAVYERSHPPGYRWLHESFGTNWRMTEVQAAIGRCQLRKLPDWIGARQRNAGILVQAFAELPALRVPVPGPEIGHAYYRLYAFCRPEAMRPDWSRDRIVAEVTAVGVPCFSGSCSEIYRERAFEGTGFVPPAPLPVARELGETSLAFLVHPTLADNQVEAMADVISGVVRRATR